MKSLARVWTHPLTDPRPPTSTPRGGTETTGDAGPVVQGIGSGLADLVVRAADAESGS
jgi:hypothetical protein